MATSISSASELAQERGKVVDRANWETIGETPRNVLNEVIKVRNFVNKLDNVEYSMEFAAGLQSKEVLNQLMDLLRENMKEHYEASGWGWNEKKKLRELKDEDARFIILRDASDNSLVAFIHFRFAVEDICAVLYCYELQIRKDRLRRNLGKRMMTILEMIGRFYKMEFVMLTVLLHNKPAHAFYKKIGYIVDETSPQMVLDTDGRDIPYEILSKRLM